MHRSIAFALVVLFTAPALLAGLAYNVESTTSGMGGGTLSGTVRVDGKKVRLDVSRGDGILFKDGAVVVSTDGGSTLSVMDPASKSYYAMDISQIFGDLGGMMKSLGGGISVAVENPRVSVRDGGAAGKLEGYDVRRSTVETAYDLTMNMAGQKIPIRIEMNSEVYWTGAIGAEYANFLQLRGLRTGIESLDKLLATQTSQIEGFPLKQVTTSTINMSGKEMKTTSTSAVTSIRPTNIDSSKFTVPEGYARVANPAEKLMQQLGAK
jgi:hypothetical protein